MKEFILKFSTEYPSDLKSIIFSKREWGTYESKIEEFKKDIRTTLETLKTFPNIGSNVSSRVDKKTDLKYSLIHDRVLVYRVLENDGVVHVLSLWFTRSNWLHMILD